MPPSLIKSSIVMLIHSMKPFISDNSVLAAGKYLISDEIPNRNFELVKPVVEALAEAIVAPVSGSVDTKRLTLVVVRTVSRVHSEVTPAHLIHPLISRV